MSLTQDLRFAFRMIQKNPGFCTIAVWALLGIGAETQRLLDILSPGF